jgi:hypothetical protein
VSLLSVSTRLAAGFLRQAAKRSIEARVMTTRSTEGSPVALMLLWLFPLQLVPNLLHGHLQRTEERRIRRDSGQAHEAAHGGDEASLISWRKETYESSYRRKVMTRLLQKQILQTSRTTAHCATFSGQAAAACVETRVGFATYSRMRRMAASKTPCARPSSWIGRSKDLLDREGTAQRPYRGSKHLRARHLLGLRDGQTTQIGNPTATTALTPVELLVPWY